MSDMTEVLDNRLADVLEYVDDDEARELVKSLVRLAYASGKSAGMKRTTEIFTQQLGGNA